MNLQKNKKKTPIHRVICSLRERCEIALDFWYMEIYHFLPRSSKRKLRRHHTFGNEFLCVTKSSIDKNQCSRPCFFSYSSAWGVKTNTATSYIQDLQRARRKVRTLIQLQSHP